MLIKKKKKNASQSAAFCEVWQVPLNTLKPPLASIPAPSTSLPSDFIPKYLPKSNKYTCLQKDLRTLRAALVTIVKSGK